MACHNFPVARHENVFCGSWKIACISLAYAFCMELVCADMKLVLEVLFVYR